MHYTGRLMKTYPVAVVILTCFGCASASTEESRPTQGHPVVHTTNHGWVRGNTYAVLNSTVHVFWSIPFAEPPIGQLRFQRTVPKPIPAWSGVLDGTRRPDACYQLGYDSWTLNVSESEDCLYLNVFMPDTVLKNIIRSSTADQSAGRLRPVMFYMYGGGYASGTSSIERYNSSALAILNDVVVVTSNYRLGSFGYLYSASDEAPGNAGLYDQLTALRWVHDNIRSFGGDPEEVTIFGHSAGSFSVGHMIVSKLTYGLFNKAILMSGVSHPHDFLGMNSLRTYTPFIVAVGDVTNCSRSPSSTLAEVTACLKLLSADELAAAQRSQKHWLAMHGPIADADYFGNQTDDVLAEASRRNLTVLMGVVTNDGGGSIVQCTKAFMSNDALHDAMEYRLITMSKGVLNDHQRFAAHFLYTNWNDVNDGVVNRQLLADVLRDALFVCPMNEFAYQLSNRRINVYYYVFNERPSISPWPEWEGVVHADELHFVFGQPLDSVNGYTEGEAESSRRIIKIFGNFAKYGVPSWDEIRSWPKYTTEHKLYVELRSKGQYLIKENLATYHCALWNNLIPKLGKENFAEC